MAQQHGSPWKRHNKDVRHFIATFKSVPVLHGLAHSNLALQKEIFRERCALILPPAFCQRRYRPTQSSRISSTSFRMSCTVIFYEPYDARNTKIMKC